MYALMDTDTCSCCESQEHEELIEEFITLEDAGKYLVDNYDHENLLRNEMDHIVLRDPKGRRMSASEVLRLLGYDADRLAACKIERHRAVMEWLNLEL
jgi:hypothetical protein